MNHFFMLIVISLCIAVVFALISHERRDEQTRYFIKLLLYMVVGSVIGGWVMSAIPW